MKTLILLSGILITGLMMPVNECIFWNISAHAQDNGISSFSLSGYGTLACTMDDRSDMAPMRDFTQKPDGGYKADSITWKLDSRLGLHAHYRFSPKVEFVVQGVVRDQVELTFANSVELAYAAWKLNTQIDVRAGRLSYDVFMMSDTRNLGYAYLWVRPPPEFYAWIPFFSVDGMDAAWMIDAGDAQWRIKAQAGSTRADMPFGIGNVYNVENDNVYSLTISRQSGPLRIKAGYSQLSIQKEAAPLMPLHEGLDAVAAATADAFPGISAEAALLRKNVSFADTDITYMTLGAAYDDGTWVAQAEVSHSSTTANITPTGNMAYIGLGRRIGDWTPYLLFSTTSPTGDVLTPDNDWRLIGQEALQNQAVSIVNSIRTEQDTWSVGVRWDFHSQAAVKLQWDNSYVKSYYGLWWHPLLMSNSSHINMWTFSMEVVF